MKKRTHRQISDTALIHLINATIQDLPTTLFKVPEPLPYDPDGYVNQRMVDEEETD